MKTEREKFSDKVAIGSALIALGLGVVCAVGAVNGEYRFLCGLGIVGLVELGVILRLTHVRNQLRTSDRNNSLRERNEEGKGGANSQL